MSSASKAAGNVSISSEMNTTLDTNFHVKEEYRQVKNFTKSMPCLGLEFNEGRFTEISWLKRPFQGILL